MAAFLFYRQAFMTAKNHLTSDKCTDHLIWSQFCIEALQTSASPTVLFLYFSIYKKSLVKSVSLNFY